MNKTLVFVVIGLTLLILGAVVYVSLLPREDTTVDVTTPVPTSTPEPSSPTTADTQPGTYTDYSPEVVAGVEGTKLLFFHAPWCAQCRQIETSITTDGVPPGVTVFKVDYDANQDLRIQYDVTLQTTFVKIDDNGDKIASYVAYEEPMFSSVERELLP